MSDLISAVQAHKLANPTFEEGLARYKDTVADAITEAAAGGVERVQIRIPGNYAPLIVDMLKFAGYSVDTIPGNWEGMSFHNVTWSEAE